MRFSGMRFFIAGMLSLSLCITVSLCSARAEQNETYFRIIGSDNSIKAQSEKLFVRDRLRTLCPRSAVFLPFALPLLQKEAASLSGASAVCALRVWKPNGPFRRRVTLLVTLGEGKGHNWWGILYPGAQEWSFLDMQKNAGSAQTPPTEENKSDNEPILVFSLWDWLQSVLRTFQ